MAVGLAAPAELLPIAGVRLATAAAGLRYQDRADVTLFELAPGARTAAVFTRNAFCAAPVMLARWHLARADARYLLINSGNANAGTGEPGLDDARACCKALAEVAQCREEEVLPFSTGVIGQRLPVDKLIAVLPELEARLSRRAWFAAAEGIMTTDTIAKGGSRRTTIGGAEVTLTGIAKGAGMIRPDMATMLAFVATDADIPRGLMLRALSEAVERSFHRITIDGDTSTNDACVLTATGKGALRLTIAGTDDYQRFVEVLVDLLQQLAQAIVRDAEGATKFVTVRVQGARTLQEADSVAFTIAHSPLVKTALFASDPNWGRILAAAGRAGVEGLDPARVDLYLGAHCVARRGALAADYREEQGKDAMSGSEIVITLDLHRGTVATVVWTSDLSHDYVSINAAYRT